MKRLLIYNIQNTIRLEADVLEIAEKLWSSLTNLYDRITEMEKLHVEESVPLW